MDVNITTAILAQSIVYGGQDYEIKQLILDILDLRDDNTFIQEVIDAAKQLKEDRG